MYKWKSVLLLFALFPIYLQAQQYISGTVSRNTEWGGRVYINGDVIIPNGVVLSIKPGTQILIKPDTDVKKSGRNTGLVEIIVLGKLIARGDKMQGKIRFTVASSNPRMNQWYGIEFKNLHENSILENVIIEYGYKGITCYGSSPLIENSEILYNYHSGISCEVRARPEIKNSIISGNGFAGINCELASYPLIESSLITQNENGIIAFDRSQPDLGHVRAGAEESQGLNQIFNNFEYNIYNHSRMDIYAQNNIWNTKNIFKIRSSIYDRDDNPSYGKVIFFPIWGQRMRVIKPPGFPPLLQNTPQKETNKPGTKSKATMDSIQNRSVPELNKNPLINKISPSPQNLPVPEKKKEATKRGINSKPPRTKENLKIPDIPEPVIEAFLDEGKRVYIHKEKPEYPPALQENGIEGTVLLEVIVDRSGKMEKARVLKSDHQLFTDACLKALRKFIYKSGTYHGNPVSFKVVERFVFSLEK